MEQKSAWDSIEALPLGKQPEESHLTFSYLLWKYTFS